MKQKLILWAIGGTIIFGVGYLGFSHSGAQVEPSQNVLMERVTGNTAIEEMFGGKDALETVAHPDKVDIYRLDPFSEHPDGPLKLDNFLVTAGPIAVPQEVASRIADVLRSSYSYQWDAPKACLPLYGVRLAFHRAADHVDVMFCFECDLSLVFRNGRRRGGGDFERAHNSLLRAVQDLFPNDKAIQDLKPL